MKSGLVVENLMFCFRYMIYNGSFNVFKNFDNSYAFKFGRCNDHRNIFQIVIYVVTKVHAHIFQLATPDNEECIASICLPMKSADNN